jgi:hypothetical protein
VLAFVGDLSWARMFGADIPFVGDDRGVVVDRSRIDRCAGAGTRASSVGGQGGVGSEPGLENARGVADLALTRRLDLRLHCAEAVSPAAFVEGLDFEAAYRPIDWSRYTAALPAFEAANRRNAYQTYLNVEQEALQAVKKTPRRP